jgi:hypothetical protein
MQINGKLKENGQVEIAFDERTLTFTAEELDQALQKLAELRSRLPELVPQEQPPVDLVYFNPVYKVRLDRETKACLLSLRHGGFGWLNFELPTPEVLNMRTMWNHIVDRMDLEPAVGMYDGPERRRDRPH